MSAGHRKTKKVKKELEFSVVGLRYRVTPSTQRQMAQAVAKKALKVKLVREPKNSHDENAIAVYTVEEPWRDFHIGYLIREVAAELAPKLDSDKTEIESARLVSLSADGGSGTLIVLLVR